jgi:hypothetical protein
MGVNGNKLFKAGSAQPLAAPKGFCRFILH